MSAIATLPVPTSTTTPPPLSAGPRPWKWSCEQYYELDKLGFFQDKRVQLIFGEIIEMSPLGWSHVRATSKTAELLKVAFAGAFWVNEEHPFRVAGSLPQPDIAVIPGKQSDYTDHPDRAVLVVEVADTSFFTDTTTKAELYATASVPEYWVLDLDKKQLHVFRDPVLLAAGLGATAYQTHLIIEQSDTISPIAAANITVRISDLLP